MRIYSEKTNKEYKTVEECQKAENEWDVEQVAKKAKEAKLAETRKERAKEVDAAYRHYLELLNAFLADYKTYHYSYRGDDGLFTDFFKYAFTW